MTSPQTPLLDVVRVTKRFPGVVALREVSLDVRQGEVHAICGENGAGKSTLMKMLAGVITEYEGELRLRGEVVKFAGTRAAEEAGISIIHQELNLVEQLSAAANIFLGREKRGWLGLRDDRAMERAAGDLLRQLECEIQPHQPVRELRGGDQQLVEIAKALSLETRILIMDEPTSALTESEVARLFRVMDRLKSQGVTILYISHKMDEIFRLADRISVLRDGQLVKTVAKTETNPREVSHLMVGREIEESTRQLSRSTSSVTGMSNAPNTTDDLLLEVRNLSLPWSGHARGWRLQNINFQLRRGEVLGMAGLMGAGRTELLESLFGASPEQPQGEIWLQGRQVRFTHPAEAKAAGLALVTEDRKRLGLFSRMDVGANITLCQLHEAAHAGLISARKENGFAQDIIARLAVKTAGLRASITGLSGGNQQKCIIGRWLLTQPKVLLLDDPTRGVDVGAKAELYRLIHQLCDEGLGVIVTSSELPELLTLADRILVLCEGRLTGEFPRALATEQNIMEAATQREPAMI